MWWREAVSQSLSSPPPPPPPPPIVYPAILGLRRPLRFRPAPSQVAARASADLLPRRTRPDPDRLEFRRQEHPQWYYNLKANPQCEFGDDPFIAAEVSDPDEYARLFGLAGRSLAGTANTARRRRRSRTQDAALSPRWGELSSRSRETGVRVLLRDRRVLAGELPDDSGCRSLRHCRRGFRADSCRSASW